MKKTRTNVKPFVKMEKSPYENFSSLSNVFSYKPKIQNLKSFGRHSARIAHLFITSEIKKNLSSNRPILSENVNNREWSLKLFLLEVLMILWSCFFKTFFVVAMYVKERNKCTKLIIRNVIKSRKILHLNCDDCKRFFWIVFGKDF